MMHFWLVVAFLCFVLYAALRYSGRFVVRRHILINTPIDEVFDALNDVEQYKHWLPWLITQPNADIQVDQHRIKWRGRVIGEGFMKRTRCLDEQTIELQLCFLHPMRLLGKVVFSLEALGTQQTQVTWTFASRVPVVLHHTLKKIRLLMGRDFNHGLQWLKTVLERKKDQYSMNIVGLTNWEGAVFFGKKQHALESNFRGKMNKILTDLSQKSPAYASFCLFEEMNYTTGNVVFHCGFSDRNEALTRCELKSNRVFKIVYKGGFEHMQYAWSAMMQYVGHHQLLIPKDCYPFEVHVVGAWCTADTSKWETHLYCPIYVPTP